MRLSMLSIMIALTAALAISPAHAATPTIKVPKSPANPSSILAMTLAATSVDSGEIHLTNIRVNGQSIGQPVAPGSTVQISFDWSLSQVPGCPDCVIEGYIGFQGAAATCFVVGFDGNGSSFSSSLTAPGKPGTYLIMVDETLDNQCDAVTSGGGGLASIAAAVVTLKVK
jgi:hypothetical protein